MAADFRGDPSAALLEVLDPEQNHTFVDHYLDVEYDLSKVMFIATANVLHSIPPALQDRMEVIRLSGYTPTRSWRSPGGSWSRSRSSSTGSTEAQVELRGRGACATVIERYTREAGVRNLEREIASICRKVARRGGQRRQGAVGHAVDVRRSVARAARQAAVPRADEREREAARSASPPAWPGPRSAARSSPPR